MDAEEGQFLTRTLASFAQKGTGGAENVSVSRVRHKSSNYTLLPPSFHQSQEGERVSVSPASQHTQKDDNRHSDESFDYEGGMNELSEMMRSLADVKATLNKANIKSSMLKMEWASEMNDPTALLSQASHAAEEIFKRTIKTLENS